MVQISENKNTEHRAPDTYYYVNNDHAMQNV